MENNIYNILNLIKDLKTEMPRKRTRFTTPIELIEMNTKFKINKLNIKNLQNYLLYNRIQDIALLYGMSKVRLDEICRKQGLFRPINGFWQRKYHLGIIPLLWENFK